MDQSKKPIKKNPKENANFLSRLLFIWIVPILCKGTLNRNDLMICLKEDRSETLGDKLEKEWDKQMKRKNKNRKILRDSLINLFLPSVAVDGLLLLITIVLKSLAPFVLAQLLKQYQHASMTSHLLMNNQQNNSNAFAIINNNYTETASSPFDVALRLLEINNNNTDIRNNSDNHNQPLSGIYSNINKLIVNYENDNFGTFIEENDQKHNKNNLFHYEYQPLNYSKQLSSTDNLIANNNKSSSIINSLKYIQEISIGRVIRNCMTHIWHDTNCLSFLLIGILLISIFFAHHADLRPQMVGARMRIACSSLIYRKTLRLNKKNAGKIGTGYLINLLSNDVSRLDNGFIFVNYIWILPLQSLLICYFIWQEIGVASIIGVLTLLIQTIPLQTGLSKWSAKKRLKVAQKTDTRVGLMNEIIQGIQVIKMYAWEKPFNKLVSKIRQREIDQIRVAAYIKGINFSVRFLTERVTLIVTILAIILLEKNISADIVFSIIQFFNCLQLTASTFYPLALSYGAEAFVAINRIQEYLIMDENDESEQHINNFYKKNNILKSTTTSKDGRETLTKFKMNSSTPKLNNELNYNSIEIKNVSASWIKTKNNQSMYETIHDLSLNIKRGQLCVIIGPVGAGKSSLLHLLLRELPMSMGVMNINDNISYASQEPWLFSGTIRNNILFGQSYDENRYKEVIKCCALNTDFQQFPYGDKTIVGERGTTLSGGQRARISLARAIYKTAQIYLLDDPLSAVDPHISKFLFENVIGSKGYLSTRLKNTTRILVTHQINYLIDADLIVIIKNGEIFRQGTYMDVVNSELNLSNTILNVNNSVLIGNSKQTVNQLTTNLFESSNSFNEKTLSEKCNVSMRSTHSLKMTDQLNDLHISNNNLDNYMHSSNNSIIMNNKYNHNIDDYNKKNIDDDELGKNNLLNNNSNNEELQIEGIVSFKIWKKYFQFGGKWSIIITMLIMLIISQILISSSDYFIKYWTQLEYQRYANVHNNATSTNGTILKRIRYTTSECLTIYSELIFVVLMTCLIRFYLFLNICMKSSKSLHNQMFGNLLSAPMRFFNKNPLGCILNRFSKDMGAIDEVLPHSLLDAIEIFFLMFGIFFMIGLMNPILIVVVLIVMVLFTIILKTYLKPSQDLNRLEGITKSPVFSHLSSTINGLSTIHAFNLEENLTSEFDNLQDVHSSVWQLMISLSTSLGLLLDFISILFVACVTLSFSFFDKNPFSGNVGLAITQALSLTGFVQFGLRKISRAMLQMTNVERVLQYTNLEKEENDDFIENTISDDWPKNGKIEFKNMSLYYGEGNESKILKNLFITIEPNWLVGIIGRTGAGKSSLINALFRLSSIDGEILIDNIDTSSISLKLLRTKISIIPQIPVLFSATLRYNLDPFNLYSDDLLWRALEDVELKNSIRSLDCMVTEGGNNFSVGQRQLICLARAILRNNKILILDEATANCDPQTDAFIQHTIRRKFTQCTILMIAHRLHTVMDADRIIVMDNGHVMEFDIPHLLLQKDDSLLKSMLSAIEPNEANFLRKVAYRKYSKLIDDDTL